jgi:hypothetical protein
MTVVASMTFSATYKAVYADLNNAETKNLTTTICNAVRLLID